MIFKMFVRRQVELGHFSCRLSCGHIPIHSISKSTNYVDQLDKSQSVSLGHLVELYFRVVWRVIKEHRWEHPDYKLRIHVAVGRNILNFFLSIET